ncbi:MAG: outer membrane lipoprotein-sorting protein [Magnetococcales bacterium]|nr:outer membrane lipoprotein-sorting protein [Magnetococcales bacterium]MBF0115598.1 outer membrane lipoprotein-sorting protein [Magnetococcales bacterium]
MMKPWRMVMVVGICLLLMGMLPQAWAEGPPLDAARVLAQVDRKLRPEAFESFAQVTIQLANGRVSQFSLYGVGEGGKRSAVLILAPEALLGRAILRVDDGVWMHVPGELELRTVTLLQSLTGGLLTNADLLLTDYAADYKATLVENRGEEIVLELTPQSDKLPYGRQVMRVDRKRMLPNSISQFSAGGSLVKTLTFEQYSESVGFARPTLVRVTSGDNKSSATWQLTALKSRTFPPEAFSKAFLPKVGSLFK